MEKRVPGGGSPEARRNPSTQEQPDRNTGAAPRDAVTMFLLDEGSNPSQMVQVTRTLADALTRASTFMSSGEGVDVSFPSAMLGLVTGRSITCVWLRDYFAGQRISLDPLYRKLKTAAATVQMLAREADGRARASDGPWSLRPSISMRQALDEAHALVDRQRLSEGEPLHLRHLVAAFIFLRGYHEHDYADLGIDRPRWGAAFVAHLARVVPAETQFWRSVYEKAFPDHPLPPLALARQSVRAEYDADAYTQEDLLEIEDEVQALAYIISSTDTIPPLSIGLFGEWGSGKTFFMKHLRRRIERLAETSRRLGQAGCYPHIAQIEFNAWHYQDGDLWASLVDHILRNLRFGEDELEGELRERGAAVIKKLEETQVRLEAATKLGKEAGARVVEAEGELASLQEKQRKEQEKLAKELAPAQVLQAVRIGLKLDPEKRDQAKTILASIGVEDIGDGAAELQGALLEARRELSAVRALLMPLLHGGKTGFRILALLVAVATPIVAGWIMHQFMEGTGKEVLATLASMASGFATFLVTAGTWVRRQLAWVRDKRAKLEPIARAIDNSMREQIEELTFEQGQKIAEQITEIQKLKQEEAIALQKKEVAAAEAEKLTAEAEIMKRETLLSTFLDRRLRDGEYQKRLGLAALVRRDFEKLSRHIEKVNEKVKAAPGGGSHDEPLINRIVLYVDDLDRCSEAKVVEVLRAVHLLLAFPAFVVVVGVDSRWVAHCLKSYFPAFLEGLDDGDALSSATPLDYLEKIFQIPIWLEPMSPELRVKMAKNLFIKTATPASAGAGANDDATPSPEPDEKTAALRDGNGEPGATGAPAAAQTSSSDAGATRPDGGARADGRKEDVIDTKPAALRISDDESAFVERLGPLLSPSPRVLKRFVNTYRLFKATQPASYFETSAATPPDYQLCMFLLAILVGMPELSRVLQVNREDEKSESFSRWVDRAFGSDNIPARARREWADVAAWLKASGSSWHGLPYWRVAPWIPRVGRYTFNLSRLRHGRIELQSAGLATNLPKQPA